jgi:hypothetical protein
MEELGETLAPAQLHHSTQLKPVTTQSWIVAAPEARPDEFEM